MGRTAIPWAHYSYNPWWGCVEAGPECDSCYARTSAKRYGFDIWGKDAPRRFFGDAHWREPEKWNRDALKAGERRRVFCASMADVLEARRDLDAHRARLWTLIDATPQLDWLLLTKRPAGFLALVPASWHAGAWPRNAFAGTTCGTEAGLARVRTLIECAAPAPVRFVSAEPLLEPIDFAPVLWPVHGWWMAPYRSYAEAKAAGGECGLRPQCLVSAYARFVDWIIVGGESGNGSLAFRPMPGEWAQSIADQCQAAGAAYFFKQTAGKRSGVPLVGFSPRVTRREFPVLPS